MAEPSASTPTRRFLLECSGACGDLGTFVPHVIGAITVAGLAPAGVLLGYATFLIATGLFYGLASDGVDSWSAISIIELAEKNRLPAIYPWREYMEAGGLMAYATDLVELLRRMANDV